MRARGRFRGRVLLLMAGDALVALGSYSAIVWIRRVVPLPWTVGLLPVYNAPLDPFPWLLGVAVAAVAGLHLAGTYDEPIAAVRERGGFLVGVLVMAAGIVALFFVAGRSLPRTVFLVHVPLAYGLVELWRLLAEKVAPIGNRPVLVLGAGEDAGRAARTLASGAIAGHTLLEQRTDLARLGTPGALASGLPAEARDVVFASQLAADRNLLFALLELSAERQFSLWILPDLADIVASRVVTRSLGDLPLVPVVPRAAGLAACAYRRALDLLVGIPAFVAASPLLVLATAAVWLESPGPPWIRQRRVGRGGKEFRLFKIRTMVEGAEEETGPVLAAPADPRVTRLGRLLRRTRVDELPQLLHVLDGSMSLIGPRPERPEFVERYEAGIPAYRLRHLLKPGLTGMAQVMGVYATQPEVKLRYDLGYLLHWNPLLDAFILIRTVSTVLRVRGT